MGFKTVEYYPQNISSNILAASSHHSSMVSMGACNRGSPWFKSQKGREWLILNKKEIWFFSKLWLCIHWITMFEIQRSPSLDKHIKCRRFISAPIIMGQCPRYLIFKDGCGFFVQDKSTIWNHDRLEIAK